MKRLVISIGIGVMFGGVFAVALDALASPSNLEFVVLTLIGIVLLSGVAYVGQLE